MAKPEGLTIKIRDYFLFMANSAYSEPAKFFFQDKVTNMALVFAVLVHAIILFSISFESETTPASMMQEVADVLSSDDKKREKADFMAANSQQGSGTLKEKLHQKTADNSSLEKSDEVNFMSDLEDSKKKQTAKQYMQSYLRTTLSIEKVEQKNKTEEDDKKANDNEAKEERILAQIATLEAQVSKRQQIYAKSTKVKTLTSAMDTQKTAEAAYVHRFRERVEHIGNTHYPVSARVQNLIGDVRLMVILSSDGKVKAIRMLESSGHKLLDEYAKATVRQGAPYGKFSKDILKDYTELRLIRTWQFTDTETITINADAGDTTEYLPSDL